MRRVLFIGLLWGLSEAAVSVFFAGPLLPIRGAVNAVIATALLASSVELTLPVRWVWAVAVSLRALIEVAGGRANPNGWLAMALWAVFASFLVSGKKGGHIWRWPLVALLTAVVFPWAGRLLAPCRYLLSMSPLVFTVVEGSRWALGSLISAYAARVAFGGGFLCGKGSISTLTTRWRV